jgi:methyltransferase (TIGR00027 family)
MDAAKPSRTAWGVAFRRACHQLHDPHPLILTDPVAVPILGHAARPDLEKAKADLAEPGNMVLRLWLVTRSRYAEQKLAEAVAQGVQQYVLLGAGLDTFAHRNPHPGLRVFEVDHPATQAWKRNLVTAAQLPDQPSLNYVPINFETAIPGESDLATRLLESGFDPTAPAFFAWLGVVLYLTLPAFRATIRYIAARPPGSGLVFDYTLPRHAIPPREQVARDLFMARVASIGEPMQLSFRPAEVARELSAFYNLEDLGTPELNSLYFANRPLVPGEPGFCLYGKSGRLLSAWL